MDISYILHDFTFVYLRKHGWLRVFIKIMKCDIVISKTVYNFKFEL